MYFDRPCNGLFRSTLFYSELKITVIKPNVFYYCFVLNYLFEYYYTMNYLFCSK